MLTLRPQAVIGAATLFASLTLFCPTASADGTDISPNTEQGNILLRAVDIWFNPPSDDIYVGHVGILDKWDGTNSSAPATTFSIYEQGARTGGYQVISYFPFKASNVTMTQSSYKNFRENNFLWVARWNSPVWTYTGSLFAAFTPEIRRTITEKANDLINECRVPPTQTHHHPSNPDPPSQPVQFSAFQPPPAKRCLTPLLVSSV